MIIAVAEKRERRVDVAAIDAVFQEEVPFTFGGPPAIAGAAFGRGAAAFGDLRMMAFFDAGMVSNRKGLNCDAFDTSCRLSAAGLGVRFAVGLSQWRFDVARASNTARETARGDVRLHFVASVVVP